MKLFKIWDIYAYFYDSILCLFSYQKLMNQSFNVLKKFTKNPLILDVGCGTGNFAKRILNSDFNFRYIGIDGSKEMLSRAVKKTLNVNNNLSFLKTNLNDGIVLKDSSVDVIVSLNVLYSVFSPENLIQEFNRVLKFGGIVILANPHSNAQIRQIIVESFQIFNRLIFKDKVLYFLKNFFSLVKFFIILPINIVIKKRASQQIFHFLNEKKMKDIFEKFNFKVLYTGKAYGKSDLFFVATKIIKEIDEKGMCLSVELVHRKKELNEIFKMRYRVYCDEMKSLNVDDFPKKIEIDKYDDFSVHFLLKCNDICVGSVRLIKETCSGFLMEEEIELPSTLKRDLTLEASRVLINKEFRGSRLIYFLCEGARIWSVENGFEFWCLACQINILKKLYEGLWNIIEIGDIRDYHGIKVKPLIRIL